MTAAIGVFSANRRPMSSVTFAIVSCALSLRQRSLDRLLRRRLLRLLESDPPELLEETDDPLEPVVLPFRVLLDRPDEEQIEPNRIGAVAVDVVVGDDDVPLDLDIFAPFRWSILGEEARERLAEADEPVLLHHLDEEAGVEQVENRVLDSADVLVDREPVSAIARSNGAVVPRIRVAEEVPGRVDERVHRVGLSPRLPVAGRTRGAHPVLRRRQR